MIMRKKLDSIRISSACAVGIRQGRAGRKQRLAVAAPRKTGEFANGVIYLT